MVSQTSLRQNCPILPACR